MFIKYPKMKSLFKLIPLAEGGKKWSATLGEILPETAPLHFFNLDNLIFTEKIDGTNAGISIIDREINIQKRNSICGEEDKFYFEILNALKPQLNNSLLDNVIIYGELVGPKIQKGGNYFSERHFLVFDIYDLSNNKFFTWSAVEYFCHALGLLTVPVITYYYPSLAVDNVKIFVEELMSVFNSEYPAEGIVIRHQKDTSFDNRYIAKIRRSDFK